MAAEITWIPAWRMRELIAKRELSPVEVVDHFLARIEEHDGAVRAFRHVDAQGARAQARRAEEAVLRGDELGLLHGIPVSVKEHIAVEGMPFRQPGMGMEFLGDSQGAARHDDLGVTRLRESGAILVGTNRMPAGIPIPQGRLDREPRNPWDLTRTPGWSSSGGAAAAAARLLPVTIGTDGGGSTRLPGAFSGVVAVHPANGRIPSFNYDLISRANPTITMGPIAIDARDAAMTLQAMSGPDGRDFDCIQYDAPDLLTHLEDGAEGMRLAWTDDYGFAKMYEFPESPRVIAAVREAAMGLKSLGAAVETTSETWVDFWPGYVTSNYLFGGGPTGAMPRPDEAAWKQAADSRQANWKACRRVFASHDLLLSATTQMLAPRLEDWDSYWKGRGPVPFPHTTFAPHYTSHTHLFNWLGFPAVSLPAGFVDGLPVALQVVGLPGREDKIFRLAHAFLKAFPRNERPKLPQAAPAA